MLPDEPGIKRLAQVQKINDQAKPAMQSGREKITLIGRYATWDRKQLAHQTYSTVFGMLSEDTMIE
jgi:hypothetical protein